MISRNYIENIRKSVKQEGDYKPTAEQIREAILKVCPDCKYILQHKMEIVQEVIKMQGTSNEIVPLNAEETIVTTPGTQIQTMTDKQNQIQPASEESQADSDGITVITNNSTPETTPPVNQAVEKEDYLALLDESHKTTTITTTQKGEIVQKAFSQLGFTATESEVFEIVKAFETTTIAEEEFFALVLPRVKEWIKRKTEERVQKYESAYQEIASDVCESLQEIVEAKEKFETNLFTFRQTLESVTDNFRDNSRKSISNIQEFFAAR